MEAKLVMVQDNVRGVSQHLEQMLGLLENEEDYGK